VEWHRIFNDRKLKNTDSKRKEKIEKNSLFLSEKEHAAVT